ncbi:MAG: protoheme IX farnesyltransferase [Bacteroidetes bacterium]|nr:protoheme IX farnesyltransferase [Bacteroidota bacterium]
MNRSNAPGYAGAVFALIKFRITFAVTLSTFTGYVMFSKALDAGFIAPVLGVFLLAAASSALNQIQEKRLDTIMLRTRQRPLPAGHISFLGALMVVIVFFLAGTAILLFFTPVCALFLGWLAFFWYNAVYTPLKKVSVFAVVAGSLIGALPPVIGWVSAGGNALSIPILAMAFFFFIWQVPHFIMLLLKFGTDYEKAGLPTLTTRFTEMQIRRIIFIWTLGTAVAAILLPFAGVFTSLAGKVLSVVLGLALPLSFLDMPDSRKPFLSGRAFMKINIFLLMIMLLVSIDNILY